MMKNIKVASICMTSRDDKAANIKAATTYIEQAAAKGADWVLLPELFTYHGPYANVWDAAETEDGPLNQQLAKLAQKHKIILFAGSVPERPMPHDVSASEATSQAGFRRVFNTAYVFGRDGATVAKYRKIHLFNLIDPAKNLRYCESDGCLSGQDLSRFKVEGWDAALAICYDLRFAGFFGKLATPEAPQVIVIPSAFTKVTGEAHWELLLRARAVEWQCYVIAADQVGEHYANKESFGHSMIIDPWGNKLADTEANTGIAMATLDPQRLHEVRTRLPALVNRRQDLY